MSAPPSHPRITAVSPLAAVAGGVVTIRGPGIGVVAESSAGVRIGGLVARVVYADRNSIACLVPNGLEGGAAAIRLETAPGETAFVEIGVPVATGVHQVDSPAFGDDGTLYLTYSGARGDQSPVSIFRLGQDGFCEPFVVGIMNPTSLAWAPSGRLFVSSRFDGAVFAIDGEGQMEQVAKDLGVSCGLAFSPEGTLYVGDRSGTIFKVSLSGEVSSFATLPPSVAAFHLAMAPTGSLFVTAPTLSTRDGVHRVDPDGRVTTVTRRFGRPQGLAFDMHGTLHVAEALAGASGLHRVREDGATELVVTAPGLVGVAFDRSGAAVLVSDDTAYRFGKLPSSG